MGNQKSRLDGGGGAHGQPAQHGAGAAPGGAPGARVDGLSGARPGPGPQQPQQQPQHVGHGGYDSNSSAAGGYQRPGGDGRAQPAAASAQSRPAQTPTASVPRPMPARKAALEDFVLLKTVGKGSFGKVVMVRGRLRAHRAQIGAALRRAATRHEDNAAHIDAGAHAHTRHRVQVKKRDDDKVYAM